MNRDNCWTWDGWLGKCIVEHPPQWWQSLNAYSIIATVAALALILVLTYAAMTIIDKKGRS